jgi:SAM-dependent methyltransferase
MKLSTTNLDIHYALIDNFIHLEKASVLFKGVLLDIGCGRMPYKEFILSIKSVTHYIGLDLSSTSYKNTPDMEWDGVSIPLEENSVDTVIATQFLEHHPEPTSVLREIYRVLKPSGVLFLTVPFIWPFHDVPTDQYRFTPFALSRLLQDAGYFDISINPYGGWDASLAAMIGLWVRRRKLSRPIRFIFSCMLMPLIWILRQTDDPPSRFYESSITQGLWATCAK